MSSGRAVHVWDVIANLTWDSSSLTSKACWMTPPTFEEPILTLLRLVRTWLRWLPVCRPVCLRNTRVIARLQVAWAILARSNTCSARTT